MAQEPADRFASATEMAAALGQAAEMVETPQIDQGPRSLGSDGPLSVVE